MVGERERRLLADAVAALREGDAGAWAALTPLTRLADAGADASIDFTTLATIGAPLVVLRPQARAEVQAAGTLTARQAEVVRLIAEGRPNKAIARALGISVGTVKDHVHAALTATGAANRTELAALVHGRGSSTRR